MIYDLFEAAVDMYKTGGICMHPLILCCFLMWYFVGKKYVDLVVYARGDKPTAACIENINNPEFRMASWQRNLVANFKKDRTGIKDLDENVIEALRMREEGIVTGDIGMIALFATVAPLLGLLGTVSGMISTFDVIREFGTGNARSLAAGISEALITTEAGLVISVPGLFFASFLLRRSGDIVERVQRFCLALLRAKLDTAI